MIILIRHGQTQFNRDKRLQGRLDSPLTAEGLEQARRMGRLVKGLVDPEDAWSVTTSPLGRAVQTATILREEAGLGCPVETDERLIELDVGLFDGLTHDQILAVAPDTQIAPGWIYRTPGGESESQLKARLQAWLAEVDEADGRRRVVVSHGIAGRMLRHLYAAEPLTGPMPEQDAVFVLAGGRIERLAG